MRKSELLGVALVGFGFVVVFQRGLAGLFDLSFVFVTGIGVIALVVGLNYANEGRQTNRRITTVDDVEPRFEVPTPGDDTDELLSTANGLSRASIKQRRELHQRIVDVTHETLAARGDYPGEEATETAIRTGSWTDDAVAAWFVGEDQKPPLSVRLRGMLGSDTEFAFAAGRTIDALAAVRGLDPVPDADDEAGDGGADAASADETGVVADATADSRGAGTAGTGPGSGSKIGSDGPTGGDREETWKLTGARE
jgi:hypothetical protein